MSENNGTQVQPVVVQHAAPTPQPQAPQVDVMAAVPDYGADGWTQTQAPRGWHQGQWDRFTRTNLGRKNAAEQLKAAQDRIAELEKSSGGTQVQDLQAEIEAMKARHTYDVGLARFAATNPALDDVDVRDLVTSTYEKHAQRHSGEGEFPGFSDWLKESAPKSRLLQPYFGDVSAGATTTTTETKPVVKPNGDPNGGAAGNAGSPGQWVTSDEAAKGRERFSKDEQKIMLEQLRREGKIR